MSIGKDAAILSSNAPAFGGKPPKPAPQTPRAKAPTSPGLGSKMRLETSHALEQMLKKGAFQTGLEDLVKAASALPTASMAAQPHPLMAAARALPGQAWGAVKRPLGLAALGAAGAVAYVMHRQNVEDHEKNPLVYAPLPGSAMA